MSLLSCAGFTSSSSAIALTVSLSPAFRSSHSCKTWTPSAISCFKRATFSGDNFIELLVYYILIVLTIIAVTFLVVNNFLLAGATCHFFASIVLYSGFDCILGKYAKIGRAHV